MPDGEHMFTQLHDVLDAHASRVDAAEEDAWDCEAEGHLMETGRATCVICDPPPMYQGTRIGPDGRRHAIDLDTPPAWVDVGPTRPAPKRRPWLHGLRKRLYGNERWYRYLGRL